MRTVTDVNTVNQLLTYSKQAKGRPFYFIKADRDYCGSNGIRDDGMLDSALANPFQSFGDEELYPSIQAKAAQLCFGIVKNHPMVDGNKRLGSHVMLVFLS